MEKRKGLHVLEFERRGQAERQHKDAGPARSVHEGRARSRRHCVGSKSAAGARGQIEHHRSRARRTGEAWEPEGAQEKAEKEPAGRAAPRCTGPYTNADTPQEGGPKRFRAELVP